MTEVHALDDYYLAITLLITIGYQLFFFSIAFSLKFDKLTGMVFAHVVESSNTHVTLRLCRRNELCGFSHHYISFQRPPSCPSDSRFNFYYVMGCSAFWLPPVPDHQDWEG